MARIQLKWWDSIFGEKSPDDSSVALSVTNVAEIALSHTVSEINAFLCFTQKIKKAK